jgi:hypothetical protein
MLSFLKPIVLRCAINDKWNIKWFIPIWMSALKVPQITPLPKPKHIFIFCAYRIEFTLNLALSVLLAWRGHRVTLGYLPKLQSPVKPPLLPDHPSAKSWLVYALSDVYRLSQGKIKVLDLTDADIKGITVDEQFIQKQAYPDTVQALKQENLDLSDPKTKYVFEYMCNVGRQAQIYLRAHFKQHTYDLCLIPNGTTYEGAHAVRIITEFNIPVNTFEKFAFRNIRVINHGNNFLNWDDLDLVWRKRQELGFLDKEILKKVCAYSMALMEQRKVSSTKVWAWSLQTIMPQDPTQILPILGIPLDKKFVLVCTNVPYDAGYERLLKIFPSMREWLIKTVRFLLENTNLHVVVRAHPGEAAHYGGRERSEVSLAKAGLKDERLIVLPGETKVNTYVLMEKACFGVVFSSTVGMEMAMIAKRVLVGGGVYYAHRGFTDDAETQSEYFDRLDKLVNTNAGRTLDSEAREKACLFYFLLHCAMQQPYPYDKPSRIKSMPPRALLKQPDIQRYIDTFDSLCMTLGEFEHSLHKLFAAEKVFSRIPSLGSTIVKTNVDIPVDNVSAPIAL